MNPRELSFRIWDGKNLHYLDNDYCYYLNFNREDGWILWFQNNGKETKIASFYDGKSKLQEFTGLFDKAARPIYEGDVVKVLGGDWKDAEEYYYDAIVVFDAGGFKTKTIRALKDQNNDYIGGDLFFHIKEGCEIIGNIYENPELLED